jgi:hypothetical protein
MGMGQEETPVFRTEVVAKPYDWGLWLLAILAGMFVFKRL